MSEKKPVYNGYEELYLTGIQLQALFANQYLTTGRHHSVVIGLSIPEYLQLLDVNSDKIYRIFMNQYFCRIMDSNTDKFISFFGHSALNNVRISVNPADISLEKNCPVCGAPMKLKDGKFGKFLGCSKYPSCEYTANIPIIGNYRLHT